MRGVHDCTHEYVGTMNDEIDCDGSCSKTRDEDEIRRFENIATALTESFVVRK